MRRRFTSAIVVTAASLCAAAAAGQSLSDAAGARVNGAVSDTNGAYIARARVTVESGATRRELSTNDEGVYDTRLPAGTYRLTVSAPGFCPFRETRLGVEAGRTRTLNVTLRVAAIVNVMQVRGAGAGSERDELRDAATGAPCSLDEAPARDDPAQTPAPLLASARPRRAAPAAAASKSTGRVVNLSTRPGAVVWVDEVRRGVADAEGKLSLRLTPGRHTLRARAKGFAEKTLALLPTQRGALSVALTQTADEAELLFQQAEEAREKGKNADAVELYRQALRLRPKFAAAHLGLARSLESQDKFDDALAELEAARRDRPVYPESWAVEGRIQRSLADHEAALAAYGRALREARGFQPEAHTGVGIVHEDKGRHAEAADAFRKAIAQLSDTEPVLYELLARNLEKLERWKEAVAAYEKYLQLAPQGAHASAINSIIDQLRRQAEEAGRQEAPPL